MQSESNVDDRVVETIKDLLAKNFGNTAAKAMEFYADPHIALANPDEYGRMMQNIFGGGTGLLLKSIVSGLCTQFGVELKDGMTFAECIAVLKSKVAEPPHP